MKSIAISLRESKVNQPKWNKNLVENLKIYFVIKPLQKWYASDDYPRKLALMRQLPPHTVGNDIAKMLDQHDLKIIPKFENHDLKHLILGYGMNTEDEIKMQAFLFGNGNKTLPCILFLLSGLLFPNLWTAFYQEYKKGQIAPSIYHLKLNDCLNLKTSAIQKRWE